jgi:hypothetical protein
MKHLVFFTLPLLAAIGGCGHHRPAVSPDPSPDLEVRADQEARASATEGERVGPTLYGVAYHDDQFTDFRMPLEGGNCYWFGLAEDPGIKKFAVYIWSPSEKRLASERVRPPQGVFKHCAEQSGVYRLEGKVGEGAGHFAVVIYKTKAAEKPALVQPQKADLAAVIEKQAASAAPGATRQGDFYSGTADTSEWYTSLEAGKCYWVIGAGEPGKVKKLFIYLWDPQNKRVTESRSDTENVMVGHCAKTPGMYKFQAKVDSGSGEYKVGVYVK